MNQKRSTNDILPLIYRELRQLAEARLAKELPGNTLTPTALVHEVYLKLNQNGKTWESEAHFFGAAANSMRQILIDKARNKLSLKRGGSFQQTSLETIEFSMNMTPC